MCCIKRSAWSAAGNGTVWGRAHQPSEICCFPKSLLISSGLFEAPAAEREGCWGAACAFWISQPVWASDSHVSLHSPHGDTLTSASCLWHQPALYQLFAVCWKVPAGDSPMSLAQCRHGIADKVPLLVEARSSQYLIPCGFPCGNRLQQWSLVEAVVKAWKSWQMHLQGRVRVLGSSPSHWQS